MPNKQVSTRVALAGAILALAAGRATADDDVQPG